MPIHVQSSGTEDQVGGQGTLIKHERQCQGSAVTRRMGEGQGPGAMVLAGAPALAPGFFPESGLTPLAAELLQRAEHLPSANKQWRYLEACLPSGAGTMLLHSMTPSSRPPAMVSTALHPTWQMRKRSSVPCPLMAH